MSVRALGILGVGLAIYVSECMVLTLVFRPWALEFRVQTSGHCVSLLWAVDNSIASISIIISSGRSREGEVGAGVGAGVEEEVVAVIVVVVVVAYKHMLTMLQRVSVVAVV